MTDNSEFLDTIETSFSSDAHDESQLKLKLKGYSIVNSMSQTQAVVANNSSSRNDQSNILKTRLF